ncbi:hypothetical protein Zmor_010600 [Zophobas morio]|uniref:Uncharacterized protein n=1 Tax=Zophobas morio TaxID=2755281 RepID=A0AA38INV2_9CUCU|nr:hypothetical protein Zmor_010600 [Zophobas morio]
MVNFRVICNKQKMFYARIGGVRRARIQSNQTPGAPQTKNSLQGWQSEGKSNNYASTKSNLAKHNPHINTGDVELKASFAFSTNSPRPVRGQHFHWPSASYPA